MNNTNTSSLAVGLTDLIPSLTLRFVLHIFDVCCSLITVVTLSRWRKMRSYSMSLICLMMANEFVAALVIGSLEGWHIFGYVSGTSESGLTGRQCFWRTGFEGPVLVMAEVSSMIVSLDRVFSIVMPAGHEKLPFAAKVVTFILPFICGITVLALLAASSSIKRLSLEVCSSTFLIYDSEIGALGLKVAHTFMTSCTYSTAIIYTTVLILIFMKRKIQSLGNADSVDAGSLEQIKAKRYRKMNKVLAFSSISYFLTSSTANTIYLYIEDRKSWMEVVAYFFHGLYAVDGIVTFTAFYFFISSFKKQLLGKSDE